MHLEQLGWRQKPLLLVQGDDDHSAALQQSLQLYPALWRRHVGVEALVFPGELYSLRMRRNQEAYIRRVDGNSRRLSAEIP